MSRIVIDTNILYSLIGLSENQKVINSQINSYKLSITTTSLIEAIVKHHDDLPAIKLCIERVIKGDMELISIGHTPISNHYLLRLHMANDINDVSDIIEDIRSLKISREAEFYRFILILVISGLFEAIREDGYKFDNDVQNSKQLDLIKALLESNMDLFLDFFKKEIREGYEKESEQKIALEAFQLKIIFLLKIFHFNYHMVKTNCIFENNSKECVQAFTDSLEKDSFDQKFKKYVDSPISYISKKKHHSVIDNYLKIVKSGMSDFEGLTEKSLSFLINKIEDAFKQKSKIRKNDIFDFLIIISLNMKDTKIVTLDKNFINGLREVDNESFKLCTELGYAS